MDYNEYYDATWKPDDAGDLAYDAGFQDGVAYAIEVIRLRAEDLIQEVMPTSEEVNEED